MIPAHENIQMPEKVRARQEILDMVCVEYGVTMEDLLGKRRMPVFVDARKDAARRLSEIGFSISRIAQILKRDHTTIEFYFGKKEMRQRTGDHPSGYRMRMWLPEDLRAAIGACAARRGITPSAVFLEWLRERAAQEGVL
jgi:hypothetical protein